MRRAFACISVSVALITGAGGSWAPMPLVTEDGSAVMNGVVLERFEKRLDSLREELKIAAMSVAIVKDQKLVWAKGLGYSDLENKVRATEHTSYHLASLTKTFASTILMQLIQDGKVKLDDPVSKYGINLESEGVIRVRHLFSHTSEGNPGEQYRYNGNRYAELDKVIQRASGKSFAELLMANILEPLGLNETALNAPPQVRTKSQAGADSKAEEEVKAAMMDLIAGFNNGNLDQSERRVAAEHSSFKREGGLLSVYQNFDDLRRALAGGLKVGVDVSGLECAVYGNAAVTTSIITVTITPPGGKPATDRPFRASYLWNKQDGIWKLVHSHESSLEQPIITDAQRKRFETVSKNLAQPYQLDKSFTPVKGKYPEHFSVSAGLMSSVLDMAKYDIAIDQNRFVSKETQQLAFTPAVSTRGTKLPYGLGWFTQDYKGTRLIWHYGYWTCNSSLILKVPDRGITFIAMANTDNLSRPTDLGAGDVTSSPVGLAFLKTFIFPEIYGEELPIVDWSASESALADHLRAIASKPYVDLYKKELLNQGRIYASVGRQSESPRLFKVYAALYNKPNSGPSTAGAIAQITQVADDADRTAEFTLPSETKVRVFGVGEGDVNQMYDYGWIENVETGKTVWEMKASETSPAGGAGKNRKIDTVVTLPAGRYKLRYRSDDSHSYGRWNALPPDVDFWGIGIYPKTER